MFCFVIPAALLMFARSPSYQLLMLGMTIGYALPLVYQLFFSVRARSNFLAAMPIAAAGDRRTVLSGIWRFGWPVALWLLCQQGLLVSDRYFVQRFSGYADAGVYASMYDVTLRSFSLLFMPVTLAVHPLIMNRWNAGEHEQALEAIRSGIKYQFIMFIPVVLSLAFAAPWVSRLILGTPNLAAARIVLPLALGGFLWQVGLLAHKPLEILCQTKRMLAGILVAFGINIWGNWMLVPRYGYRASAYLAVASSSAYLLMLFILTPLEDLRKSGSAGPAPVQEPAHTESAEPVMTSSS